MNKNNEHIDLKDHSRFNRWVRDLDEKDKSLNPSVRKSKWILILASVFVIFGLSFFMFPNARTGMGTLQAPVKSLSEKYEAPVNQSFFEMPVDSFENHLKTKLYDTLPEKE